MRAGLFLLLTLLTGTVQAFPVAGSGRALLFDGNNEYVSFNGSILSVRTLELWFRPDAAIDSTLSAPVALIVRNGVSAEPGVDEFGLYFTDAGGSGAGALVFAHGQDNIILSSAGRTWNAGQWYHAAVTLGGASGAKLYVDGELEDSDTTTAAIGSFDSQTSLGRWGDQNGGYFAGTVDEIRAWNQALSHAELYGNLFQPQANNEAGLAGYWRCDDSAGTVLTNAVDTTNNGSLSKMEDADHVVSTCWLERSVDEEDWMEVYGGYNTVADTFAVIITDSARHGSLYVNNGAVLTEYYPDTDYAGPDSFTYVLVDTTGGADTVIVIIDVRNVNDPPVITSAAADTATEDVPYTYIGSAADIDGTPVISFAGHPAWLNASGDTLSGTPPEGVTALSFTVTADDGEAAVQQPVVLTVIPVEDAPSVGPDTFAVAEDGTLTVTAPGIMANDRDVDRLYHGLAAYWTMDDPGNLQDISGYGRNGTGYGSPAGTSGVVDAATEFDGTGDYYLVPDHDSLDGGSALSMALWIRPEAYTVWGGIAGKFPRSTSDGYGFIINEGSGFTQFWAQINSLNYVVRVANAQLPLGQWHHLAATYDGAFLRLYVNGAVAESLAATGDVAVNTHSFCIGRLYDDADMLYFRGGIDEVAVWRRAISPSDVAGLYNTGSGRRTVAPVTAALLDSAGSGTLDWQGDGGFRYVPAADFYGSDTFTYVVQDTAGLADTGQVFISITGVNDVPVITSAPIDTAEDGSLFTYIGTAADVEGDSLTFTYGGLPGWLSAAAETLWGTPGPADADTAVSLIVSDGSAADTLQITLTVLSGNGEPVITSAAYDTVFEDSLFRYVATAVDPDSDTVTISFSGLPGWLTVSGDTVSGIPGNGNGDTSFTVLANDGIAVGSLTVQVTVRPLNDMPYLTSAAADTVLEDSLFRYVATADDPDGDTVTISFIRLPGWLTVAGDTVSGTPDSSSGDTLFAVILSDGGLADTVEVTVIVVRINEPPVITSAGADTAVEDGPFTYIVTAMDPDNDSLTVTCPTLPGWLACSGDTIRGVPGEGDGDTVVTVLVSDGFLNDTLTVALHVIAVNDPPVITSPVTDTLRPGDTLRYIAAGYDPEGNSVTFTFPVKPRWVFAGGGAAGGIVPQNAVDTVLVVVADDGELTDTLVVSLVIEQTTGMAAGLRPVPDCFDGIFREAISIVSGQQVRPVHLRTGWYLVKDKNGKVRMRLKIR